MNYSSRLRKVRDSLDELHLDAQLLVNREDIRYLSGFSGDAGLGLVGPNSAYLFLDFRFLTQADQEVMGFEVKPVDRSLWDSLAAEVKRDKISRLGFSPAELSYERHRMLEEKAEGIQLVATRSLVTQLRMIKDPEEAEAIRRSGRVLSQNLDEILPLIKPGMKEGEIAALFEYGLRMKGADKPGFETIVASGERSAMPHAHASPREIRSGEFLKIDGGAQWNGYHSDITRTVVLSAATSSQEAIHRIVLEAHDQAIAAIRPGMTGEALDQVARKVIEEAGYGRYFGHGTGHGVGLSVHEEPRIGRESHTILEEGMAFTIEPGIYLPGVGGVRIEDTILLTEKGPEVATTTTRRMTL